MPGPDVLEIGTAMPTASCADGVVSVLVLCELGSSSNTKGVRVVLDRIETSLLYCGFQHTTECVSINRDFVLEKEQWFFWIFPRWLGIWKDGQWGSMYGQGLVSG